MPARDDAVADEFAISRRPRALSALGVPPAQVRRRAG
jgi:hypothetical protein